MLLNLHYVACSKTTVQHVIIISEATLLSMSAGLRYVCLANWPANFPTFRPH